MKRKIERLRRDKEKWGREKERRKNRQEGKRKESEAQINVRMANGRRKKGCPKERER